MKRHKKHLAIRRHERKYNKKLFLIIVAVIILIMSLILILKLSDSVIRKYNYYIDKIAQNDIQLQKGMNLLNESIMTGQPMTLTIERLHDVQNQIDKNIKDLHEAIDFISSNKQYLESKNKNVGAYKSLFNDILSGYISLQKQFNEIKNKL